MKNSETETHVPIMKETPGVGVGSTVYHISKNETKTSGRGKQIHVNTALECPNPVIHYDLTCLT